VTLVIAGLAMGAAILIGLAVSPLSATPRAAVLLGAAAALALVDETLAAVAGAAVVAATGWDATRARALPTSEQDVPATLARALPARFGAVVRARVGTTVRVRQPGTPDVTVDPSEAAGSPVASLDAQIVARRRGRQAVPAHASRVTGRLGLAAWYRTTGTPAEVVVYPDVPGARRLAAAVRQGRFRDPGQRTRGPLGLGTEFESVRDYLPDDDIRQVNWRATARRGHPMSNQYRVEQDRDVIGLLDCGRLMAASLGDRTRLDAAIDALTAVAFVADEVGDRCGVVAFDTAVRRRLAPRRRGGDAVLRAIFDLEPTMADADYEVAFRAATTGKRSFMLVFTDLLDEAAARALLGAMTLLTRRHVVTVASAVDPDLDRIVRHRPDTPTDVFAAAVALDVLAVRARVVAQLTGLGAKVVEARPEQLPAACVAAYVRAKARAQL
jgi:uncharacterized protein (DUF58 family)